MFYLYNAPSLRFVSHRFLDSGFVVSAIFKSCLEYLRNCQTLDQLRQIQTQIFVAGLHQNRVTNYHLMAFCADQSLGDFAYAEKIFNHIPNPSLFLYNLMIRSHVKRDCFDRAVSVFERLRVEGLCPDSYTYPSVLKAIGCLGRVWAAKRVHGLVMKTGFKSNPYVFNSLINAYGRLGELVCAKTLFDEMPERVPVSWNVLICAYVRRGKFDDAVGVFRRMRAEGGEGPSEGSIVSAVSACTALRDVTLGEEVRGCIGDRASDELGFTANIRNALLDMYVKCGCLSAAQRFFDEMPDKNVISVTTMVSGYVNCGKLDEARGLFERYPVSDVVLWTALINGYVRCGRVNEAMLLFGVMQSRRITADKFTMVCLLSGCALSGDLEKGEWIHSCIKQLGIKIDGIVGTALIDMYAKCGLIDKSLEVFEALGEKNTSAWTAIICGLARNSEGHRALEFFEEMRRAGVRPDELTFTGVLNACSNACLVEEGRRYFCSMTEVYNIEPNMEHHKCLIDLFGRAGLLDEAQELVETLVNAKNENAVPLYGALLRACGVNGNVELGERVARRLRSIKPRDSRSRILLSNIYASAERCEDMRIKKRDVRKLRCV